MGRYIHAENYSDAIIFKYWCGQNSELEVIIQPFGGRLVRRAEARLSNFDLFSVSASMYSIIRQNLTLLVNLLEPYVKSSNELKELFLALLNRPSEEVGARLTMLGEPEFLACKKCLDPTSPSGVLGRLDLILCLLVMRPDGILASEIIF